MHEVRVPEYAPTKMDEFPVIRVFPLLRHIDKLCLDRIDMDIPAQVQSMIISVDRRPFRRTLEKATAVVALPDDRLNIPLENRSQKTRNCSWGTLRNQQMVMVWHESICQYSDLIIGLSIRQ